MKELKNGLPIEKQFPYAIGAAIRNLNQSSSVSKSITALFLAAKAAIERVPMPCDLSAEMGKPLLYKENHAIVAWFNKG